MIKFLPSAVEDDLRHNATHDPLTGLFNRSWFADRLAQRIQLAQRRPDLPFAVLFMDLDSFKLVNDFLGHRAGDALLQGISTILRDLCRPNDYVARLGGDEFIILTENLAHADDAHVMAERILQALPHYCKATDQSVAVGASIGIALYAAQQSAEQMMGEADAALYQAKHLGKGRYVIYRPNT